MKTKKTHFDVELIIDHKLNGSLFLNNNEYVSSHHLFRGLDYKELFNLIQENIIPEDCENIKITMNIRGTW